jgi:hypothetical protein
MSFNKASSAQGAPIKASPGDKPTVAPPVSQPAQQPDKKPATVAPAYKK